MAKDAEIEDIKLGGAKVSRKMLETKRFEEVADSDDEPSEEWLRGVEMEGDGSLGKTQETTSPASNSSSANSTLAKNSESTDPIPRKRSASTTSEAPFTALLSQPPGAKEKAVKLRKKKLGLWDGDKGKGPEWSVISDLMFLASCDTFFICQIWYLIDSFYSLHHHAYRQWRTFLIIILATWIFEYNHTSFLGILTDIEALKNLSDILIGRRFSSKMVLMIR